MAEELYTLLALEPEPNALSLLFRTFDSSLSHTDFLDNAALLLLRLYETIPDQKKLRLASAYCFKAMRVLVGRQSSGMSNNTMLTELKLPSLS